ncbi:MAG: CDP-alcohol phosphatidyltransferase family protein [Proteobacteria bacterium]|nr:CDP-alcohol phosphatidyltransferase family protein [Pseudomonadota bacterium]MDA1023706.1 CDP-alcohol phosphatidyltransferase family protein [Pseudomonadota bacterium]
MSLSIQINMDAGKPGNSDPAVIRPSALFPLSRQLGYFLSLALIRLPVSANQVTFISMLVGLSGCALFANGEVVTNIYGALLLVLSYALDYCDGVIARLKDQCSPTGAAFDDFVDWIVDTSIFAGLGYGVWVADGQIWWLWLGLIAAGGSTIDYIVDLVRVNPFKLAREAAEKEASGVVEPEPELSGDKTFGQKLFYIFHTLSRAEFCFIILVLSAFDVVWVLLPFGAIGAQAFWLGDLFRKRD